MFCNFLSINHNSYECVRCGNIVSVSDGMPPTLPCVGIDLPFLSPNLVDDREIERRYDICSRCEFFKEDTCSECGCIINRYKNYNNKLKDRSASCPKDKW